MSHFKRAIRRKLTSTEVGLGSLYNSNVEFQTFVRYLWALSLLPETDICDAWEDFISSKYDILKDSLDDEDAVDAIDSFLEYFEKTWVGSLNWRTKQRRNPMFAYSMWNKYNSVLTDDPLTSNSAEGYNSALSASLPVNCGIWTLIQQLRTEESMNMKKLRDVLSGLQNNLATNPTSSRNLGRKQRHTDLKAIVSNYNNVSLDMYMNAIIDFYNFSRQ